MNNQNMSIFLGANAVSITDPFWGPVMERVRTEVIPYQWEALNDRVPGAEPSYCMRNFMIAAQMTHPELDYGVDTAIGHGGCVFQDSDFAKWIEAAAWSLVWHPDAELEKTVDGAIDIICNAQQADGYLNTYFIINGLEKRFTNLMNHHELYCFGHFLEAAIAYFEATGKRKLLDAMIRYADCIDRLIGPEEGKIHGYPGHEITEMALVRLYEIVGDEKYLAMARYFIDERGKSPLYFPDETKKYGNNFYWKDSYIQFQYYQAGKPVREQHVAEGHSVRAVYLYSGMADTARLTGDRRLLEACDNLFTNISRKQMYITGGIGQSAYGEMFSYDYDLPNDTVYAETCASIGLVFFARRMASIFQNGEYADVMERALYNGVMSGMSLDGKAFFYVNPLEVLPEASLKDRRMRHVKIQRQKWFGCACCPPNLARIIASLGGYIHSVNETAVYTHLYIGGNARFTMKGKKAGLNLESRFPWNGNVAVTFSAEENAGLEFTYGFRVPSWCADFSVKLNNAPVDFIMSDGFALVKREWKNNDRLEINFEMPVTLAEANPRVRQNAGKLALVRGPVVYCLEEADNGKELFKIRAGSSNPAEAEVRYRDGFLGGVNTICLKAKREKDWKDDTLYRPAGAAALEDAALTFIPYYAWANRGAGEMTVWVNK